MCITTRVHPEADQNVRSTKLSLAAISTESIAAVTASVLLDPKDADQMRGTVGEGGQNSQLEGSEAGGEIPGVSSRGGALRPKLCNVKRSG